MQGCEQFTGMSVLDHGLDVHARYLDLLSPQPQLKWRMPEWVDKLKPLQLPFETIKLYQLFHDCGKPFCRTVDENGKQHFPNHAQVSYETWMQYAETPEDAQIGKLILMDMDAHTAKGDAINEFIKRPEAATLLLTALSEIHSNASHLGQMESDNFKIKLKQISRLGKRIIGKYETDLQSNEQGQPKVVHRADEEHAG